MKRDRQFFEFGAFRIYPTERLLERDDQPVPLKPKVFDLLMMLVRNSGHVLKKDELMREVWAGSFVEESNLTVSISALRKALGEDRERSYIETVPRHGYRFVASVTEVLGEAAATATELDRTPKQIELYATANDDNAAQSGSIAVLPFKHLGPMPEEYLGLGLADALITRLSNLKRVTVRPTSSVRHYNGSQDPVAAGKELRVEWVLDGSVQKVGKRVRVTVQLVKVDDGASRWAEQFDEKFTDIFAVEDWISKQVAKAVTSKVTRRERNLLAKRYTYNAEAYEAYMKGRYFFAKKNKDRYKEALQKGIEYFNQAIAIDPNYALAYAGLADCYAHIHYHGPLSPQEAYVTAEQASFTALELDGELAEAYASLAHVRMLQWDFASAEKEFTRAIELKPNWAPAHNLYSIYLRAIGRFDDALAESSRALEIDPLSVGLNSSRGLTLWLARRYDDAIHQLCMTLELDPDYGMAHFNLGLAYQLKGMYGEALIQFQRAITLLGENQELSACLGRTHALSGSTEEALKAIDELRRLPKENNVEPHVVALIYEALGDKDAAFEWLERGFAEHDEGVALLKVDPRFDTMRDDPRFTSLLERVGLSDSTSRQTLEEASGRR